MNDDISTKKVTFNLNQSKYNDTVILKQSEKVQNNILDIEKKTID